MSTKNQIINSAIKNFLIFGYEKASLSKIASDVGIRKPSIYYHFKNKEEIFIVSIEYLIESMENKITYSINNFKTSKDKLNAIFNSLIEFNNDLSMIMGEDHEWNINIYNFLHHEVRSFPHLNYRRGEYYTNLKEVIMGIIKTGQTHKEIRMDLNIELISLEIIAWIEGLFMLNSIYTPFSINALRQDFFNNLWRMLSIESTNKKNSFGRSSSPKTISLGTKW